MSVAKVIEIVSNSDTSFQDAIEQGLAEASATVRGISGLEVTNWTADVENNRITRYKVTLHVAFKVEHGGGGGGGSSGGGKGRQQVGRKALSRSAALSTRPFGCHGRLARPCARRSPPVRCLLRSAPRYNTGRSISGRVTRRITMPRRVTRRSFLKHTGFAAGAAMGGGSGLGVWTSRAAAAPNSANEKLNVAIIGAGGRGGPNLATSRSSARTSSRSATSTRTRLARRGEAVPAGAARTHDFRKMFDEREGHRRRRRQHARAHARRRDAAGAPAGQARLLREAADPHACYETRAVARGGEEAQGRRRRWARRSTPATTTAASSSWCRPARSARSASATSGSPATGAAASGRQGEHPVPPSTSTGTCGSAPRRAPVSPRLPPRPQLVQVLGLRQRRAAATWAATGTTCRSGR